MADDEPLDFLKKLPGNSGSSLVRPWRPQPGRSPFSRSAEADPDPVEASVQTWQQDPHPDNAANMLRNLKPVFDRAISQHIPGQDNPLIRAQAKQIALDALPEYDPRVAGVETYLRPHMQRLQRLAAQNANIISIPERILMHRQELHRAEADLEDKLGRMPSSAELADHTGLSITRIRKIRQAVPPRADSQAILYDEEGEPQEPAVEQQPMQAPAEFVYDSLDDQRDRLILELSLGLHGQQRHSVSEIAKRLGITASAVSQRAANIQTQLNDIEQSGLF